MFEEGEYLGFSFAGFDPALVPDGLLFAVVDPADLDLAGDSDGGVELDLYIR